MKTFRPFFRLRIFLSTLFFSSLIIQLSGQTDISFKTTDGYTSIDSAKILIVDTENHESDTIYTNTEGYASIELKINRNYRYTISKNFLVKSTNNNFSVTSNDTLIEVKLDSVFAGGNGTPENPFQIATLEHLKNLSDNNQYFDKHFILIADIDASDTREWTDSYGAGFPSIGSYSQSFTGTLNGNFHTITSLYQDRKYGYGMFYQLDSATIKNLTFIDAYIKCQPSSFTTTGYAYSRTGIISKLAENGTLIERCRVSGKVIAKAAAGGLFAKLTGSTIRECTADTISVSTGYSWDYAGGLVGSFSNSTIEDSYAYGYIKAQTYKSAFGLVGSNGNNNTINNSYYWGNQNSLYPGSIDTSGVYIKSETSTGNQLTADEFELESSFPDWDFTDVWKIELNNEIDQYNKKPYPQWISKEKNTITFIASKGGTVIGIAEQVLLNSEDCSEVTAKPYFTHNFIEWQKKDGTSYSKDETIVVSSVDSSLELYAIFELKSYTVEFQDYDESVLKTEVVNIFNSASAPQDPVRTGYVFTGWDKSFDKIKENLVIKAQYEANSVSSIDTKITNSFLLYPNPASNTLFVTGGSGKQIEIFNLLGKKVLQEIISGIEYRIDLSNFQQGYYIVKIENTVKHLSVVK